MLAYILEKKKENELTLVQIWMTECVQASRLEHGNISGEPWQLLRTIEEAPLKDPVTYGFYRTCIKQNREPKEI